MCTVLVLISNSFLILYLIPEAPVFGTGEGRSKAEGTGPEPQCPWTSGSGGHGGLHVFPSLLFPGGGLVFGSVFPVLSFGTRSVFKGLHE